VALPGSGLAVWHIDETQSNNTNPLSYMLALVQADGKRDLEFNRNSGDSGDLFPGSNGITRLSNTTMPSTRSNIGKPTNVTLSQISEKGGLVKVRIRV
jgi:immune inhibitor A